MNGGRSHTSITYFSSFTWFFLILDKMNDKGIKARKEDSKLVTKGAGNHIFLVSILDSMVSGSPVKTSERSERK